MTSVKIFDGLILPATADMHVHLRDGCMMELVTPSIRKGGVDTVLVMPNLVPPIKSVEQALTYRAKLEKLEANVTFLMSLYLHNDTTVATIKEAKERGITSVKFYPAGVTTNCTDGVVDLDQFDNVFAEMERQDLVLNLHGECPSNADRDINIMNAEVHFLPILKDLNRRFPKLRIVFEHCTTEEAVRTIMGCSNTVAGTITGHHLCLIVDDWANDSFNYCKPVPKTYRDRAALLKAVVSGNKKFFFGSDSAPHSVQAKRHAEKCAAGVFTQPIATQLVIEALEQAVRQGILPESSVTHEVLVGFLSTFGRQFYRIPESAQKVKVLEGKVMTAKYLCHQADVDTRVMIFRGERYTRELRWQ